MTVDMTARGAKRARETREFTVRDVQLRSADDGTGGTKLHLDGYASVTETPYTITDWLGDYTEVVRSGAFKRSLANNDDVRLLLNHDGLPLARTKSGSLSLAEDATGLHVDADLDVRSNLVNDISVAMERGDLDEMSFAFQVTKQEWSPDYDQRDIQEVKLFDVSVVTYPANPAASATLSQRMQSITRSISQKRALDAEDVNMLTQTLGWLSAIDNIVDEGQETLADYLGVSNPDADDANDAVRSMIARLQKRLDATKPSGNMSLLAVQRELLAL